MTHWAESCIIAFVMEKIIERGLLFDFYGELLTPHQQKIYSEAVFNDMSLSELSEEEGISRQGIHDLIKRVDKQLEGYENKLKLVEKFKDIKKDVVKVEKLIDECEDLKADKAESIKKILSGVLDKL